MNNLKKLQKLSDMSQTKIAEAVGVKQASVSGWITGKKDMTVENAIRLAEVFGVTVGCVVGTEPVPEGYGSVMVKPSDNSRTQTPPFTADQLDYLEQWKKDVTRDVVDALREDLSSLKKQA